ncbi:hypothetical protein GIB67_000264 [Kingdonia uniflora]|uniref:HMA domain-containing protein n=1 Tax=Kingdonia uniflora TaxID=39325 RepID=A0A7J7LC21_9MAGN|nr:hypothetical protein GIB67_000264 [Kingdonia uniflora]
MGEKKIEENKVEVGEKKGDGGITTVVLKIDLHCDGCAKKVRRSIKHFEGVDDVKADSVANKIIVIGKVEPEKLRERVEEKIKKNVQLVSSSTSPQSKKEEKKPEEKKSEEKKTEKKPEEKKKEEGKKSDEKKPEEKKKETPVSTVILKIRLHCDGCIQKIRKSISKTKGILMRYVIFVGVQGVTVDAAKDLVTVKGTIDGKTLLPILKEKLKRNIEIVPAKKEEGCGDKKEGGGEKKESGGDKKDGGGDKKESGTGDKKASGGGDEKKEKSGGDGEKKEGGGKAAESKVEVNKMEYSSHGHIYGYGPEYENGYMHNFNGYGNGNGNGYGHGYPVENVYAPPMFSGYGSGYPGESSHTPQMFNGYGNGFPVQSLPAPQMFNAYDPNVHAPQMFSDENPNACSVM